MRAPRDILKHVQVETAARKRKCHRNKKHFVSKGEPCLVIKEGAFAGSKNYCVECAMEIINAANSKLLSLDGGLAT